MFVCIRCASKRSRVVDKVAGLRGVTRRKEMDVSELQEYKRKTKREKVLRDRAIRSRGEGHACEVIHLQAGWGWGRGQLDRRGGGGLYAVA